VLNSPAVQVTGNDLIYVYVVLAVSLVALAIAYALRAQVLAADEGTAKMKEIAEAVQEGAAAYLNRQFKTLSYFVGIVFSSYSLPSLATPISVSADQSSSSSEHSSVHLSGTTACGSQCAQMFVLQKLLVRSQRSMQ
jgi:hypothetical protein